MKHIFLTLILAVLVAACHQAPVKCDGRLMPINPVPRAASALGKKTDGSTVASGAVDVR